MRLHFLQMRRRRRGPPRGQDLSIVWLWIGVSLRRCARISLLMKILLVDDHALIREALRGVLKELDGSAAILEASRWGDAARLLGEHPDLALVLLDLGLPDRDGFEALKEARAHHPRIPVIILSANCERASVVKALDLGAVGFIPKTGER